MGLLSSILNNVKKAKFKNMWESGGVSVGEPPPLLFEDIIEEQPTAILHNDSIVVEDSPSRPYNNNDVQVVISNVPKSYGQRYVGPLYRSGVSSSSSSGDDRVGICSTVLDTMARWMRRPVSSFGGALVQHLSWNPHLDILAVATLNDVVFLYDAETQHWIDSLVLQHTKQRGVSSIAWRPAGHELAVGCRGGIVLWTFTPGAVVHRYIDLFVRHMPGEDCLALAWSPCGNFLLWGGLRGVGVWDVNARQHEHLAWLAGASCVQWSPLGRSLVYAGAQDYSFWFYSSLDAVAQRWRCATRVVRFLIWHPSNAWLLVFGDGDKVVHLLQWSQRESGFCYSTSFSLPAAANCVACSPCGRRLVVGLSGKPRVAIIDWTSGSRLYPIGFLHGPAGSDQAEQVSFKSSAPFLLCSILWKQGIVSFVPMSL